MVQDISTYNLPRACFYLEGARGMEVALPRASGLRARWLPGRLGTVTPKRPVPFPGQRPPFGLPLLFVGDIYTRPERGAWRVWGFTPSRVRSSLFFRISAESGLRICLHARVQSGARVRIPGSLFPISCVLPPGLVGWGKGCPGRGGGAACALREESPPQAFRCLFF